ncbi:endonuclease/exonuclease/phosphatase family protein [Pontibacter vulgaris]|uniref:endonuclease/exonuclease/phosphatase family protein n=1 Tax=Pontibacter vulgaris TaxID=2905679 RepID=UPI001FA73F48|nr:endonuclease/exonuclease/phosphatase family protein [Pontibacter vulgaris]
MHYGIKIFFLFTLLTLTGCAGTSITKQGKLYTIGFYNTEKFFDTEDDPATNDDDFTPEGQMKWDEKRYKTKLKNIKEVIESMGDKGGAALLGLSEVENRKVLQDLVNTASIRNKTYSIIHYDSPDERGLDVALLYKPKLFKPVSHKSIKVDLPGKYKSPDILMVQGELMGTMVTVFVNQWPANNGSERQGDSRRKIAATELRRQINLVQAQDKDAKIIVMGDFDDEPKSANLERVLKATGRPNPYYKDELFNAFYMPYIQGLGSYQDRGNFQMLDQIMVSKSLIEKEGLHYVPGSATIHDPEFSKFMYGKYKDTPRRTYAYTLYLGGYSDHFPVYIKVQK